MATKYIHDFQEAVECTINVKTESFEKILNRVQDLTYVINNQGPLSNKDLNSLKEQLMPSLVLEANFQNMKVYTECGRFVPSSTKEANEYNDLVNLPEYGTKIKDAFDDLIQNLDAFNPHDIHLLDQAFGFFSTFNPQTFGLKVEYIGASDYVNPLLHIWDNMFYNN